MSKVWMITGAGRGMGLDFAKRFWPLATSSSRPAAIPNALPRRSANRKTCWSSRWT